MAWDDTLLAGSVLGPGASQFDKINQLIQAIKRRGATKVVSNDEYGDYYCDGTADDVQIQEAFDAVKLAGGGSVFLRNTGTSYNISSKLVAPNTTGRYIFSSDNATIQKTATMDYMFERNVPTGSNVTLVVAGLTFNAVYNSACWPIFNFVQATEKDARIYMRDITGLYPSIFLRLDGHIWNSEFRNCYVYATRDKVAWADKPFIHLLESDGVGVPKINTFENIELSIWGSDAGKMTVPAIWLEGAAYNVFGHVCLDGGYFDDALIKLDNANYNTFENCRCQDILTPGTYNGVGAIHIDAFCNIFKNNRLVHLNHKLIKFDTNSRDNLFIGNNYWATGTIDFAHANPEYLIDNFAKAGEIVSYTGTLTNKIITGNERIEHHTAADTLTKEESGKIHTNLGAGGAIKLTLPQDAIIGTSFEFVVMTAQQLQVDPGAAGAIYINGAKQTDDAYIWADDEAESVKLVADGNGDWIAIGMVGTWTVV